jgi:hypothetical protein
MHSIRTAIPKCLDKDFKKFCCDNGLEDLILGEWSAHQRPGWENICYAYSDKDEQLTSAMLNIVLRDGSIEESFFKFRKTK